MRICLLLPVIINHIIDQIFATKLFASRSIFYDLLANNSLLEMLMDVKKKGLKFLYIFFFSQFHKFVY